MYFKKERKYLPVLNVANWKMNIERGKGVGGGESCPYAAICSNIIIYVGDEYRAWRDV